MSGSEDGQLKSPERERKMSFDEDEHDTDSLDIKPPQANVLYGRDSSGGGGGRRKEKANKDSKHSGRERRYKDHHISEIRDRDKDNNRVAGGVRAGESDRERDRDRRCDHERRSGGGSIGDQRRPPEDRNGGPDLDRYHHPRNSSGNAYDDNRGDLLPNNADRRYQKHFERLHHSYHMSKQQQQHYHHHHHLPRQRQEYYDQARGQALVMHHHGGVGGGGGGEYHNSRHHQMYGNHDGIEMQKEHSRKYGNGSSGGAGGSGGGVYDHPKDAESLEQDLRSRLLSKRHKYVKDGETDDLYDHHHHHHHYHSHEEKRSERERDRDRDRPKADRAAAKVARHKLRRERKKENVIEVFDSPDDVTGLVAGQPDGAGGEMEEGILPANRAKETLEGTDGGVDGEALSSLMSGRRRKHHKKHHSREKLSVATAVDTTVVVPEKRKTPDDPELLARREKILAADREAEKLKELAREKLEARRRERKETSTTSAGDLLSPGTVAASVTAGLQVVKRKKGDNNGDDEAAEGKRKKLKRAAMRSGLAAAAAAAGDNENGVKSSKTQHKKKKKNADPHDSETEEGERENSDDTDDDDDSSSSSGSSSEEDEVEDGDEDDDEDEEEAMLRNSKKIKAKAKRNKQGDGQPQEPTSGGGVSSSHKKKRKHTKRRKAKRGNDYIVDLANDEDENEEGKGQRLRRSLHSRSGRSWPSGSSSHTDSISLTPSSDSASGSASGSVSGSRSSRSRSRSASRSPASHSDSHSDSDTPSRPPRTPSPHSESFSTRSRSHSRRSGSKSLTITRSRSPSSEHKEAAAVRHLLDSPDMVMRPLDVDGKDVDTEQQERLASGDEESPVPVDDKGERLPNYFPGIDGCRSVEEFQCLNRIEEGTYGVVYRAKDKRTNEIVALKRLKMEKEKEGFPITSLREINTLLKGQHPNIVTVREIVVGVDKIFIVMDYVEHDLKSLMETMKNRKQSFLPAEVKCLTQQLLRAVNHLHDNWILHRDLKTSNLLLSHKGILKVGDFGLAREYGSPLKRYTSLVVTLWYRAPEILLGSLEYSTPIDVWSVGCIFAEFLQMAPLFPGKSEIDQLNRIYKELGTPNERIWPGYKDLPAVKNLLSQNSQFADYPVSNLRKRFGDKSTDAGISLLQGLLTYDPKQRLTAEAALKHAYFEELPLPIDPSMFPTWPAKSELGSRKALAASPKPPSGGSQFKQLAKGIISGNKKTAANSGFVLNSGVDNRHLAMAPGFSLKF